MHSGDKKVTLGGLRRRTVERYAFAGKVVCGFDLSPRPMALTMSSVSCAPDNK